jgi:catechol 2,3-dioxygenase-like lactoylglutathione lyase family enzyme
MARLPKSAIDASVLTNNRSAPSDHLWRFHELDRSSVFITLINIDPETNTDSAPAARCRAPQQSTRAMPARRLITMLMGICFCVSSTAALADSPGRITGVGGIFVKSKDPTALAAWYRDVLGIHIENWGGAALRYDDSKHPPVLVWSAFPQTTKYMKPSTREFMIDFAVDDLEAFLAKLKAKSVPILKLDNSNPDGKFAWILDPDGTKIEFWQPKSK